MVLVKINIKEKKATIFWFLFFLSIIPYDVSKLIPFFGNYLLYFVRFLILFYGCLLLRRSNNLDLKRKKMIKYTSLYFVFILLLNIISSVINNSEFEILNILKRTFSILYVYFSVIIIIFNLNNKINIIKGCKYSTMFLILVSIILYLFNPLLGKYYAGYGEYTFLGVADNRNGYIEFALASIISILFLKNKKNKIFDMLIIIVILGTIFLTKSTTSIIVTVLALLFLLIDTMFRRVLNYKKIMRLLLFTWIFFMIFLIVNHNFDLIGAVFHKSSTLTGRTYIWSQSLTEIKKHFILGYGYDNEVLASITNSAYSKYFMLNDTHNAVLYILLSSGILGLISMIMYFSFLVKQNIKCDKNKYIYIYLFASIVRGLSESCLHYSHVLFYVMFILLTDIEEVDMNEK